MIGTIRKHQKWLWVVIVSLTIISFVLYFSPYRRSGPELGGAPNLGSIAGKRITPEQFQQARNEVRLRYLFTHGEWPVKDELARQMGYDEERETYNRLVLLHMARELDIRVGTEAVARVAAEVLRSYRRGAPPSLAAFEREVLYPGGMTREDFQRFLRHELELQQLANLTGLAGTLITAEEARAIYRHENEELTTALIVFPATNYLELVEVTPEKLAEFYSNNLARYEIPERVQVRYVRWDLTNFLAQADEELAGLTNAAALVRFGLIPDTAQATTHFTNLDAVVEAIYKQRGTNYYSDAASPEEAKQRIKDELRRAAALRAARKKAVEFANVLFDIEPVRAANLDKLASESNLTVHVSAPFDMGTPPAGLEVGRAFINAAFELTEEDPLKGPIVAEDGVYVIALDKKLPAEIPALETIREQVTRDFKYRQALAIAQQKGVEAYATLTNGLAQGKTFATVCREAGLKPIFLEPFSRRTRSQPAAEEHVPLSLLKDVAFKLAPGQFSEFVPTHLGGFIVHVQGRLPVDEKRMETELPTFLALLRQTGQSEAFSLWSRAQAEWALQNTPLAWRQRNAGTNAPTSR